MYFALAKTLTFRTAVRVQFFCTQLGSAKHEKEKITISQRKSFYLKVDHD